VYLGKEQPEVEAHKPAPTLGAKERGIASGATGYLLTEERVGFVFASGRRGMEMMPRVLLRRRSRVGKGRTLVLAMETLTRTPSPRK
jgi:hypothetical protein